MKTKAYALVFLHFAAGFAIVSKKEGTHMPHEETVRLVDGATVAVLFMHGIAGTPNHFRTLLPLEQMIPADWSVYNVLLPGHGKKVEDFARSSMAQWKSYVNEIFNKLCDTHENMIKSSG